MHQKQVNQRRGSAAQRGYTWAWQRFRGYFIHLLMQAGITPVCGASLPDGPKTQHSQCAREGRFTADDLHLHHEPPLEDWERSDMRRVCDPYRIQLLCESCHNTATRHWARTA